MEMDNTAEGLRHEQGGQIARALVYLPIASRLVHKIARAPQVMVDAQFTDGYPITFAAPFDAVHAGEWRLDNT